MLNHTLEIAAPNPNNTTNFSLQLPSGSGFVINIRQNTVYFDCFWQGAVQTPLVTRNFIYQTIPYDWDDTTPGTPYNFVTWILLPTGSYILLEKFA